MTNKKPYPRWVGVLLALFIPGSAHYFSGSKAAGIRWYAALLFLSAGALALLATPAKPAVFIGFLIIVIALSLNLFVLVRSYRRIPRPSLGGWVIYLSLILLGAVLPEPIKLYKFPAGSMQPTLRGITIDGTKQPTSIIDRIVFGKKYRAFPATAAGRIENIQPVDDGVSFSIGGEPHHLPYYALNALRRESRVAAGDILWSGTVYGPDLLTVEKISYWFGEPQRGDIVAFTTDCIDNPAVRQDTTYIKRIVGLPSETIGIKPPHLLINGEPLPDSALFARLDYGNAGQLGSPTNTITIPENEYFVLGDNTAPGMSLDSRFFGTIPRKSIVGKVSTIYWPFTRVGGVE